MANHPSKEKNSFIMYKDWRNLLLSLSNEQKGKLLVAIYDYNCDGVVNDFEGDKQLQGILSFFIASFDRDQNKYESRCKKNKNNIKKRYNLYTNEYD